MRFAPADIPVELVGSSAAITRLDELVRRVAALEDSCLLTARRGADVQPLAREIHDRSARRTMPFVAVACGVPAIERALFGEADGVPPHDLDSLTTDSRIAAARGGTLFLEDVTDLPASVQARLARAIRDGEVRLDGEPSPLALRWLACATPGIAPAVRTHRLRSDLPPPLDVAHLFAAAPRASRGRAATAARLLRRTAAGGHAPRAFTPPALALLCALSWSGNLAELRGDRSRGRGRCRDVIPVEACCRR